MDNIDLLVCRTSEGLIAATVEWSCTRQGEVVISHMDIPKQVSDDVLKEVEEEVYERICGMAYASRVQGR